MRFNAQTATIENGFVHLPQEGSWLPDYLHEITTFPGSKYKDQADSTSQALAWINGMRTRPAIIEFQKRELAREMHNRGSSLEAIAARVDATPDEVEGWMNDYKEIAARVRAS